MEMVTCDICEFADCVLFDSFSSLSTLQRSLLTQSMQINNSHLRHNHSKVFGRSDLEPPSCRTWRGKVATDGAGFGCAFRGTFQ